MVEPVMKYIRIFSYVLCAFVVAYIAWWNYRWFGIGKAVSWLVTVAVIVICFRYIAHRVKGFRHGKA